MMHYSRYINNTTRIYTMKTLTLSTGSFDQVNTFTFEKFKYHNRCSLQKDFYKDGDGIYWAMQHGGMLKAQYSDEDRAESARLQTGDWTLSNDEIVLIDGKQYKTVFKGNYSDCAMFEPV
jgi:hypothetical protein